MSVGILQIIVRENTNVPYKVEWFKHYRIKIFLLNKITMIFLSKKETNTQSIIQIVLRVHLLLF